MLAASQLRNGMAVRFEGQLYKVLLADYHPGQGKMGGATHARLLNLDTGTQWEHSFRADLKLEDVPLEKRPMQFLYEDGENCFFMDPASAEQAEVPVALLGDRVRFLQADSPVAVEFIGDRPVSVQMPDFMEFRIGDTAPPSHQSSTDNTWKPARLENGVEVMVPQFLKAGDAIRLDLNTLRYMERAKGASIKR